MHSILLLYPDCFLRVRERLHRNKHNRQQQSKGTGKNSLFLTLNSTKTIKTYTEKGAKVSSSETQSVAHPVHPLAINLLCAGLYADCHHFSFKPVN